MPNGAEEQATTGNGVQVSLDRITGALSSAGKRAALAAEVGITDGQLSKLLNGDLRRFCQILNILGLEVHRGGYVRSLEDVLRDKL